MRSPSYSPAGLSLCNAFVFYATQTSLWLTTLWLISLQAALWALPLIPAVVFYPYAKRSLPLLSVVLGLIIAYGVVPGYASAHQVPLGPTPDGALDVWLALLGMFAALATSTTSIDMIYAPQDLKDDLRAGIKSMAVTFRPHPKRALSSMALMQFAGLAMAGWLLQFGALYGLFSCVGGLLVNGILVWRVNLKSSRNCFWWFQAGSFLVGTSLAAGLACELLPFWHGS